MVKDGIDVGPDAGAAVQTDKGLRIRLWNDGSWNREDAIYDNIDFTDYKYVYYYVNGGESYAQFVDIELTVNGTVYKSTTRATSFEKVVNIEATSGTHQIRAHMGNDSGMAYIQQLYLTNELPV